MNLREEIRSTGMPQDGRNADRIELDFRSPAAPESARGGGGAGHKLTATAPDSKGYRYTTPKLELRTEEKIPVSPVASRSESQTVSPEAPPIRVVETPPEGTNEEHVKRRRKSVPGGETDFYSKPTMLSRLILNQKYGGAIRRVFNHPEEAKVWVCAKRARKKRSTEGATEGSTEEGAIYTIRQLPVHIACSSLSRTHDSYMSRLLNELISVLIFAYPEGAHEEDHRARLPIHEAIWYGAAPDTVALFLMAKPEAIHVKDNQGRSLAELNKYRNGSGKESIQHLLNQGIDFWIHARAEATTRLQHNNIRFPSDSHTISSTSVLASATAEDDTILTTFSHQPEFEPDEISPLSWDQLEKRLIASEQILTTINERNFELTKQVEALTLIDQAKGAELVRELTRMSEESALLNAKLHSIENLCAQHFLTGDAEHDKPYEQALSEMSSLVGLSDSSQASREQQQPVLQVTKDAMALHKALSTVHTRQRERIRKMRHIVEDLVVARHTSEEQDPDVDSLEDSAISALTNHSARSHLIRTMPRHGPINPVVVDRTPPPSSRQQMDDLDAILRFAAARDKARLCAGGDRRASRMPQTDDLDAILQWATTKDDSRLKQAQRRPSVSSNWSPEYAEYSPTKAAQHVTPPQSNCAPQQEELKIPALRFAAADASKASEPVEKIGAQRSGLGWPHAKDRAEIAANDPPQEPETVHSLVQHSDTIPALDANQKESAPVIAERGASKIGDTASLPSSSQKPMDPVRPPLRSERHQVTSREVRPKGTFLPYKHGYAVPKADCQS
jgi:hypothetical protein